MSKPVCRCGYHDKQLPALWLDSEISHYRHVATRPLLTRVVADVWVAWLVASVTLCVCVCVYVSALLHPFNGLFFHDNPGNPAPER